MLSWQTTDSTVLPMRGYFKRSVFIRTLQDNLLKGAEWKLKSSVHTIITGLIILQMKEEF